MLDKYTELLRQIKADHNNAPKTRDDRVLVVDALNSFIRCYSANPTLNEDGDHVGGYTGFLKSIAAVIKTYKPTRCILVFDGQGGSSNRRKLHEGYKAGRKVATRFNRVEGMEAASPEEEMENMKHQLGRLASYLQLIPVTTMSIDNIEADDAIAYMTTEIFRPMKSTVFIMSDDKDYLQLVDERISVWRPVEKKLYGLPEVLGKFGVPAWNYIHYKIFMGDSSDNIDGVNGIGPKKLVKFLPFLLDDVVYDLDDVLSYAKEHESENNVYKTILAAEDTLRLNWRLMSLEGLEISAQYKSLIRALVENTSPCLNASAFKRLSINDKLYTAFPNIDIWLRESFTTLNSYVNSK